MKIEVIIKLPTNEFIASEVHGRPGVDFSRSLQDCMDYAKKDIDSYENYEIRISVTTKDREDVKLARSIQNYIEWRQATVGDWADSKLRAVELKFV